MSKQTTRWKKKSVVALMVLALVGSLLGCDSKSEAPQEAAQAEAPAEAKGAEKAGEKAGAEAGEAAGEQASYPGVDLSALGASQRVKLAEMAGEELCPCPDATVSLDECMQSEETQCEEARAAVSTMVGALAEGAGERALERVAERQASEEKVHTFMLEDAPVKGSAEAEVVIVEFADFQCPHCRTAAGVLSVVHEQLGDEVAIYFKQFPLGSPLSDLGARATLAAHKQGRFWQMHDLIFANQRDFNPQRLEGYVRQLGLNYDRFQADLKSPELGMQAQRDRQEGMAAGVQGTPSLFINGKRYKGQLTPQAIVAAVKAEAEAAE
ncbi:DsbA family protein [Lujinxingia litoralis]|uniref:DsbA family protein n=1 Tax=Lujinxingia litoralis TaxID=2211119 RepID=UPI0013140A68|nr:thioredoxin domain-containing protein [Lujinxingia litoralis]